MQNNDQQGNSNSIKVWLDDERPCPKGWFHTKTSRTCIALLDVLTEASKQIDVVSLDHDLGDDPRVGTGYDVICWIEKQLYTNPNFKLPVEIRIHTANPSARVKMELTKESIYRNA